MPGLVGYKNKKDCLGASVPLSKGMNGIQCGKEFRRLDDKTLLCQSTQVASLP